MKDNIFGFLLFSFRQKIDFITFDFYRTEYLAFTGK